MTVSRREALTLGLGMAATGVVAHGAANASTAAAAGKTPEDGGMLIPQRAGARVIVDNDFAGDPDGLVALAHQLMSPKTRVTLVTSLPLNPKYAGPGMSGRGAALGARYAHDLMAHLSHAGSVPVIAGPEGFSPGHAGPSHAARAIVAEALRNDPLPLIFTCGGPLTNLAAALRLDPRIAKRMTVIWIGGGPYPQGAWEYNLMTDLEAARYVIERSQVPLWQVPLDAYRQMQYSIARMNVVMRRGSPLARWLYARFTRPPAWIEIGGTWPLGDSPLVLLTALSSESSRHADISARAIRDDGRYGKRVAGRMLRVYESVDARLVFDDMEALLRLQG